jgi:thioredoxin-like negative regulator of GroEL
LIVDAVPDAPAEERDRLRDVAVALFERLGQDDPLVAGFRRRLAMALY